MDATPLQVSPCQELPKGHDLIGPVTGDAPIVLRKRLRSHAAMAIAVPNTIGCVPESLGVPESLAQYRRDRLNLFFRLR